MKFLPQKDVFSNSKDVLMLLVTRMQIFSEQYGELETCYNVHLISVKLICTNSFLSPYKVLKSYVLNYIQKLLY